VTAALYDTIGRSYVEHRRPDPRIAAYVETALGDARRVVNVGAGTGSYESAHRVTVAVDPSRTMITQRTSAAPAVQCVAETLPFADASFDAATAFITIHHWTDWRAGLREMKRVAGRVAVLGIDLEVMHTTWVIEELFPFFKDGPGEVTVDDVVDELGDADVIRIPTPHDCVDGFFCAYWRRPEAYLDAGVRACISGLARATPEQLQPRLDWLAADLESGDWHRRHADLLARDDYDTGMRLVVTR
jgi:SAM-dependent methyltransferase